MKPRKSEEQMKNLEEARLLLGKAADVLKNVGEPTIANKVSVALSEVERALAANAFSREDYYERLKRPGK